MKYFFLFLFGYLLFRFIFGFVLPVYRTTKQVKKQFGDMQRKMQEQFGSNQPTDTQEKPFTQQKPANKDYIEFEEVSA